MTTSKLIGLAGLGIGIAFASGCITRGSASFGENPAEPDITPIRSGENPMPAALAPVPQGNVRYPDPRPAKSPEYWQQHNDPYAGMARPAVSRPASYSSATVSSGTTYTVKKGDILGRIAKQHGVKVADLRAANGLTGDTIRVGQKLKIPGKAGSVSNHPAGAALQSGSAVAAPAPAPRTNEVAPIMTDTPAMPDIPDLPPPEINVAPPKPDAGLQGFAPAAPEETYTYIADGNEDIYTITISRTVGISDAKRLNPQLAAEFDRMPARKLPAGTPVILPKK